MNTTNSLPANFDFDLLSNALKDAGYNESDVAELMQSSDSMGTDDVLDLLPNICIEDLCC